MDDISGVNWYLCIIEIIEIIPRVEDVRVLIVGSLMKIALCDITKIFSVHF